MNSIGRKENLPSTIPSNVSDEARISAFHPIYLRSLSRIYPEPFGAIAELVDNAYDSNATNLWIDVDVFTNQDSSSFEVLIFTDNGCGMSFEKICKMLSFGYCEKNIHNQNIPVGHYGNNFKSGSMRLGKDALVFTKDKDTRSLGFFSQTFLQKINAEVIFVPIITWNNDSNVIHGQKMLATILAYSIMNDIEIIQKQFNQITDTGTRIIISNLQERESNLKELEICFKKRDIRIPFIQGDGHQFCLEQILHDDSSSYVSLRSFLAILYLQVKMQISLMGENIKPFSIARDLYDTEVHDLMPEYLDQKNITVTFGFSAKVKCCGIMIYHRNRLIKPYAKVGCQLKADDSGIGVIGVMECNDLIPTLNKQDFVMTPLYRSLIIALGTKLNVYWNRKRGIQYMENAERQQIIGNDLLKEKAKGTEKDKQLKNERKRQEQAEKEKQLKDYEINKLRQELHHQKSREYQDFVSSTPFVGTSFDNLPSLRQVHASNVPPTFTQVSSIPSSSFSHVSNVPSTPITQSDTLPSQPTTPVPVIQNVVSLSGLQNMRTVEVEEKQETINSSYTHENPRYKGKKYKAIQLVSDEDEDENENNFQPSVSADNTLQNPIDQTSNVSQTQEKDDIQQSKQKVNSIAHDENDNSEPRRKRKATPDLLSPPFTTIDGTADTMFSGLKDTQATSSYSESSIGDNPVLGSSNNETDNNLTIATTGCAQVHTVESIPSKVAKVTQHMSTQTDTENNVFDFNATFTQKLNACLQTDNFEGFDKEILENFKDSVLPKMCLLLAQRSQLLKNLKKKIYMFLESLLDGSIQLPRYSENDIDSKDADNFLDAFVESLSGE